MVPLGLKRAHQGPVWSCMSPIFSRTLIQDSQVIRQCSSGPVGPYWVPTGFRRNLHLARRVPTRLDGSLDCPVSVHDRCTDPLGTPRRPHGPSGAPSGPNGPPADRRGHCQTPFNRRLPGLGGPQLLLASAAATYLRRRVTCWSERARSIYPWGVSQTGVHIFSEFDFACRQSQRDQSSMNIGSGEASWVPSRSGMTTQILVHYCGKSMSWRGG